MGRELKRVPMDFDWPVGVIWKGYQNPYRATKCKPCDGSGIQPGFGNRCPVCKGHGEHWCEEKYEKFRDEWEPIHPPTGSGFQLWETTSEGSPISPVFATLDELCAWAEINATTFADFKVSAAEWKKMLEANFVHHQEGNNIFL